MLLWLFFSVGILSSQNAQPLKLAELKTNYESARKRVVDPLTASYVKKLRRLVEMYTKQNKTSEVEGVVFELGSLGFAVSPSSQKTVEPLDPTELKEARAKYQEAVKKATESIDELFIKELRKLVEIYNKQNNFNEVASVVEELKKAEELVQIVKSADPQTVQEIERLFVNKTWQSPAGTTWRFSKNGKGEKQFGSDITPFLWSHADSGLVKVTGTDTIGSPVRTWFFKFEAGRKAYYGGSRESANTPLEIVR